MPSDNVGAAVAPSQFQTFLKRLLSTVVLWVVVLGALFSGYKPLAGGAVVLVLNLICFFGLMEFCDLMEAAGRRTYRKQIGRAHV